MMNFKKSQAALEFLTTYGWAFLVIIIMIGTLAYFGILSPAKLLPNRCNFGSEFQCLDYQISATGDTFKLRLKNGIGEAIDVTLVDLSSESTIPYTCTTPAEPIPPSGLTGWKSGEIKDLSWSVCNSEDAGIVSGEKGKILVTIKYNTVSSGPTYGRDVKGEVFSNVI